MKTVDEGAATKLEQSLDSGQAVVFGDVYIDRKYCNTSSITMVNVSTNEYELISNGNPISFGIWKDTAVVQPGNYRITNVTCGSSKVSLGGDWTDILTGTDKLKKALAPTFSVKGGELRHIGTMRINIIKKEGLFSNARVIVTREKTSMEARARANEALANIDRPVQFTN